ncbi:MAG TPA: MaoC family dehydratase [Aliidongia sp.]|nr:MaoC family dehydratase [Aliidongia sp.]
MKFNLPTPPLPPLAGFEELSVGQRFALGSVELTRDDIMEFARQFDPQPFHLDEAAAERSIFGGLAASGFHTISAIFGLGARSGLLAEVSLGGSGVEEARWLKPVRPDQPLSLTWTIESIAPSKSRPGRATVRIRSDVTDSTGEPVMRMVLVHIMAGKGAAMP